MRREWELDDLVDCWTLDEDELRLIANKSGATRLGFALLLKYFEQEARFPRHAGDVPKAAVPFVARQVGVAAEEFASYDWSGRTIKNHRAQIREVNQFREPTVGDEDKLADWLAGELCPVELNRDRLRLALLARCREEQIEPPGPSRIERILGTADAMFERQFTSRTAGRLPPEAVTGLEALIAAGDPDTADGSGVGFLQELKTDPGQLGLETLLNEITKLERVKAIGLPPDLFAGASEMLVAGWRARAARMYPSDFAKAPQLTRLTLLAALCWVRKAELTDGLVDLLVQLVHKISVRAERKVEGELNSEFRRVHGKQGILFKLAGAAVDHPDEIVRAALYPVVGETTLRDLVAEARANERTFNTRVRVQLRSSYSRHYRRGLPRLLKALTFRSNNTEHKPVMDALELLDRYSDSAEKFYAAADRVPLDHVVPGDWRPAVIDEDGRVERIPYELCVLVALRTAIRRREIWVEGGSQWRNPEEDLPGDFEDNRDIHYQALSKPRDPAAFIASLKEQHVAALCRLNDTLRDGTTGGVKITRRRGEPWISVPHIARQLEPANLKALKEEIARRWGVIDLLNLIKDADHVTGFTNEFTSVASRQITDPEVLRRRLLLVLFGLGTNMGIKRVADGAAAVGSDADTEAVLRRVRRLFVNRDNLRAAIRRGQRDIRGPGRLAVGRGHLVRLRLPQVRVMVVELHDRMAPALRRPGNHGVLARRAAQCLHLLPGHLLLGIRGRRHDRGPAAASDVGRDQPPVHRYPRRLDRRVRLRVPARLPAAAAAEEHRVGPAIRPRGREERDLAGAEQRAVGPAYRLGPDRPPVRPDGQVRHRAAAGHGRGPADTPPFRPRRPQAPHLPGDRGTRPGNPHHLHLQLPSRPAAQAGNPRGPSGGGELELRQRRFLLRQERRPHRPRQGTRRGLRPVASPDPGGPRLRQHDHDPDRPPGPRLAGPAY